MVWKTVSGFILFSRFNERQFRCKMWPCLLHSFPRNLQFLPALFSMSIGGVFPALGQGRWPKLLFPTKVLRRIFLDSLWWFLPFVGNSISATTSHCIHSTSPEFCFAVEISTDVIFNISWKSMTQEMLVLMQFPPLHFSLPVSLRN